MEEELPLMAEAFRTSVYAIKREAEHARLDSRALKTLGKRAGTATSIF
jgi:hypothetical protein